MAHNSASRQYNEYWKKFFDEFKGNNTHPTVEQVLDKAKELAEKYGFTINF